MHFSLDGALPFRRQFTAWLFASSLSLSVRIRAMVEVAFVFVAWFCCTALLSFVQLKDSAEQCWKWEYVFSHATLAEFNFCRFLYCGVVCSASCRSVFLFFYLYESINGIVNIAGAPWVLEPSRDVSKVTKCDRNEGAGGDWFLLRGWQMLMLTDRESDYSELWRWTSACVTGLPWRQNHSQSHFHKSHTHTHTHSLAEFENSMIEQRWWRAVIIRVPSVTTRAAHSAERTGHMLRWHWRFLSLYCILFLWKAFMFILGCLFWQTTWCVCQKHQVSLWLGKKQKN